MIDEDLAERLAKIASWSELTNFVSRHYGVEAVPDAGLSLKERYVAVIKLFRTTPNAEFWMELAVGGIVELAGWTTEWPTEPGWYWFWKPSFGTRVEAAQVRLGGNGPVYIRANAFLYEKEYPDAMWYSMEQPPAAPEGSNGES